MTYRELWRHFKERHDNPLIKHLDPRRRWVVRAFLWAPPLLALAAAALWVDVDVDSALFQIERFTGEDPVTAMGWIAMTMFISPVWCLLAGVLHIVVLTARWRQPQAVEELRLCSMSADEVWFGVAWPHFSAYLWQILPVGLVHFAFACFIVRLGVSGAEPPLALLIVLVTGAHICSAVLFPLLVAVVCLRAMSRPEASRWACAVFPLVVAAAAYALAVVGMFRAIDLLQEFRVWWTVWRDHAYVAVCLIVPSVVLVRCTRLSIAALLDDPGTGFMARDAEASAELRQSAAHERLGAFFRALREPAPWRLRGLITRWHMLLLIAALLAGSYAGQQAALGAKRALISMMKALPGGATHASFLERALSGQASLRAWAIPMSLSHPANIVAVAVMLAAIVGFRLRRRDGDVPCFQHGRVLGGIQRLLLPMTASLPAASLFIAAGLLFIVSFYSNGDPPDAMLLVLLLGFWLAAHVGGTHAMLAVLTAKRPWLAVAVVWLLALVIRAVYIHPVVSGDHLRDFLFWVRPSGTSLLDLGNTLTAWIVGYSVFFGIPARLRRLYAMPGAVTFAEAPAPQSD